MFIFYLRLHCYITTQLNKKILVGCWVLALNNRTPEMFYVIVIVIVTPLYCMLCSGTSW